MTEKKTIRLIHMMNFINKFKFSQIKNYGLRENLKAEPVYIEYLVPNKRLEDVVAQPEFYTYAQIEYVYDRILHYLEVDQVVALKNPKETKKNVKTNKKR